MTAPSQLLLINGRGPRRKECQKRGIRLGCRFSFTMFSEEKPCRGRYAIGEVPFSSKDHINATTLRHKRIDSDSDLL